MKTRNFAGREVSVIALGSSEFGGTCPQEKAFDLLDAYAGIGGNFIDTARIYGDFATPKNGESEKVIGRWMALRHNRESIFLSTKGAHPPLSDMNRGRLSREDVRGDASASLDALGTDHVDVYWLHRDDAARPVGDIMETMQSLIDDGWTPLDRRLQLASRAHPRGERLRRRAWADAVLRQPAAVQPRAATDRRGSDARGDGRGELPAATARRI